MTTVEKMFDDSQREEWEKLQDEHNAMPGTSGERGRALVAALELRAYQGEEWCRWMLSELAVGDATKRLVKRLKAENQVYVSYADEVVSKPAAGSVRTREGFQAMLFVEMTREQVRLKIREAQSLAKANAQTATQLARLDALFDRVPDAATVGDALVSLGVSLEVWLAEAS